MLSKEDIQAIVDKIEYKGWKLRVEANKDANGNDESHYFMQCVFDAPDNNTGEIETQYCRKMQLSRYMTPSEVVRTAFKAVLAAEEHEAAELFRYKGVLIYNPHVDVEALVDIIGAGRLDERVDERPKTKPSRRVFRASEIPKELTDYLAFTLETVKTFGFDPTIILNPENIDDITQWEIDEINNGNKLAEWLIANGAVPERVVEIKTQE